MRGATMLEDVPFARISRLRAAPATPLEDAPSRRGRRSHGRLSFEANHPIFFAMRGTRQLPLVWVLAFDAAGRRVFRVSAARKSASIEVSESEPQDAVSIH
jgi:hypothetical protein